MPKRSKPIIKPDLHDIRAALYGMAPPETRAERDRAAINRRKTLGIRTPDIQALGRQIGKNHELALKLWGTEIYETRILAAFIEEPAKVNKERWVKVIDSWGLCDGCFRHFACRSEQ